MKDRRKQTGKEIAALMTWTERLPYHVAAPETLHDLMQRDLDAWMTAKAAIAKAKGIAYCHPGRRGGNDDP